MFQVLLLRQFSKGGRFSFVANARNFRVTRICRNDGKTDRSKATVNTEERKTTGDLSAVLLGAASVIAYNYASKENNVSANPSDWFPVTRIDKTNIAEKVFHQVQQNPLSLKILTDQTVLASYQVSSKVKTGVTSTGVGADGATIFHVQLALSPPKNDPTAKWMIIAEASNLLPADTLRYLELKNLTNQENFILVDNRHLLYAEKGVRCYWNKAFVPVYGVYTVVVVGTLDLLVDAMIVGIDSVINVVSFVRGLFGDSSEEKEKPEKNNNNNKSQQNKKEED